VNFTKHEKIIIIVNIIGALFFTMLFIIRSNYEFIIYIFVLGAIMSLIIGTHKIFKYSVGVLWALTIWSFAHLVGGGLEYAPGEVFYKLMILPIIGEPYSILKYDQIVHFYGFWVSGIVMYYILKPSLVGAIVNKRSVIFVIVMASLGLGAVNEIVEFGATVAVPDTNVGGYVNTALDLVSDLLGALGAGIYLRYKYFKNN